MYYDYLDENGVLYKCGAKYLNDKWVLIGKIDAPKHKLSHDEVPNNDAYKITLAIADSEEEIKLLAAVLGIGEVHEAPAFRTF